MVSAKAPRETGSAGDRASAHPAWAWLYPAAMAIHVAEIRASGIPDWLAEGPATGASSPGFLYGSLATVILYLAVAALVHGLGGPFRSLLPLLAAFLLTMGGSHCVVSLWRWSYAPGTLSAAVLLVPLALFTLRWAWTNLSRPAFVAGVVAGAFMTGVMLGPG